MATKREVSFIIGANIQNFKRGLASAQKKFRSFGRKMDRIGSSMTRNLSAPIGALAGLSLKASADFETMEQSLSILNKSAKEGSRIFEDLKTLSAGTPFQLKDLARAQQTLQGFGMDADQAMESIKMLGDVSAVTGGDLQAIAVAFGQSSAEGQLMTKDIRQLVNQGVPALTMLADSMGVAKDEIFDLASQGEISFEDLRKAFKEATSEGGQFADGMEKQSKTLAGIFSTLRDNVTQTLASIGDSLVITFDLKEVMRNVIGSLASIRESFEGLSQSTKKTVFIIAGLLGASGPIIMALGVLSSAIGAISLPVVAVVAVIAGAVALMIRHWDELVQYFTAGEGAEMWDSISTMANTTWDALKRIFKAGKRVALGIWSVFGDTIIATFDLAWTTVTQGLKTAFNVISVLIDTFTGRWITDWDGYMSDTETAFDETFGRDGTLRVILDSFLNWVSQNWVTRVGGELGVGLGNLILKGLQSVGIAEGVEIPTPSEILAKSASSSRSARQLRRARQGLLDNLIPSNDIIEAEFGDLSIPSIGGRMMFNIEGIASATAQVHGFGTTATSALKKTDDNLKNLQATGAEFDGAWEAHMAGMKESTVDFGQALESLMQNVLIGFGETLGNIFSGDAGAKSFLDGLLIMLADFAVRLGKIIIGIGLATEALKKAFSNPFVAITAGIALVALGTMAKNMLSGGEGSPARMKDGGIVPSGFPNDTYPAFLSSGETVIPSPKKLPTGGMGGNVNISGEFRVKGTDLVMVLEKAKQTYR